MILVEKPSKRPSIEYILEHSFLKEQKINIRNSSKSAERKKIKKSKSKKYKS